MINLNPNYVGQVVMVQKSLSFGLAELCGQYLCVEQAGNVIYCVSTLSAYDARELRAFELTGPQAWNVEPRGFDLALVQQLLDECYDFDASGSAGMGVFSRDAYKRVPGIIRHLERIETQVGQLMEIQELAAQLEETIQNIGNMLSLMTPPSPAKPAKKGSKKVAPVLDPVPSIREVFEALSAGQLPPVPGLGQIPDFVLVGGSHCVACPSVATCPSAKV